MFTIVLTLSLSFLSTVRALAAELPNVTICTERVQTLDFEPETSEAEVLRWMEMYRASGRYDSVELVRH